MSCADPSPAVPNVVIGYSARYVCDTIAEVDEALHHARVWVDQQERTVRGRPMLVRRVRGIYQHNTDLLLNARTMLCALETLDADCERFTVTGEFLPVLSVSS